MTFPSWQDTKEEEWAPPTEIDVDAGAFCPSRLTLWDSRVISGLGNLIIKSYNRIVMEL